ncbi:hypothetical protein OAR97_02715 [Arcobacteraceae bacterium]|nr:hypothetical protein [Arcobacteraceae bacterium]
MGLKKYIVGSLLLAIIIFGYTFSIAAGDYRLQIVDFTIILPIAIWVILPMVLLLVLTIIHISFYGLKNYFNTKAVTKDSQSMISLINKRLLKETSNVTFQNQNFKELGSILKQLDVTASDSNFSTDDKEITKTVEQAFSIKSGKYISSKDLKLDPENPLMINNTKNRIDLDDNFALEILKSPLKSTQDVIKYAFLKALQSKSMTSIKKVLPELTLDREMVNALLKKDSEQKAEFSMNSETIISTVKKVELSNEELITIIKNYKKLMTPDQIIKLFEDLSSEKEEYTTAYLYVLAEYEMIDKMRDILVNSATDEYLIFKALVDLKDAGKTTYSIDALSYKK